MINNKLCHHGVKGMKWGVRRTPEQLGRKANVVAKKGTKIYRITDNSQENELPVKAYVSISKADRNYYKGYLSAHRASVYAEKHPEVKSLAEALVKNPTYEIEFKAKKDIIVPSYEERVNAFIRVNTEHRDEIAKSLSQSVYVQQERAQKFVDNYKTLTVDELQDKGYRAFAQSLTYSDVNRKYYFDELRKQGYNATIDDNDTLQLKTEKPVIVFERSDVLKKRNIKQLSLDDISTAMLKDAKYQKKQNVNRSEASRGNPYHQILDKK